MSANQEVVNQVEHNHQIVVHMENVDWSLVPPSLLSPSMTEGFALATKAVMEDHKKNYQEALMLYKACEQHFLHVINNDAKTEATKDAIIKKLKMYQDRAQVLTLYLNARMQRNN